METIYTGNEPLLADFLIEEAIKEHNVDVFEITKLTVDCFMPRGDMHLWEIRITINSDTQSYYYSKNCIEHGYTITYLQHLRNLGVRKIDLRRLNKND
jgi:hypothetical protein